MPKKRRKKNRRMPATSVSGAGLVATGNAANEMIPSAVAGLAGGDLNPINFVSRAFRDVPTTFQDGGRIGKAVGGFILLGIGKKILGRAPGVTFANFRLRAW